MLTRRNLLGSLLAAPLACLLPWRTRPEQTTALPEIGDPWPCDEPYVTDVFAVPLAKRPPNEVFAWNVYITFSDRTVMNILTFNDEWKHVRLAGSRISEFKIREPFNG
jgi:hypothetical protein